MLKFFFFLCLVTSVWGRHEIYDGHALYDVTVNFADQVKTLSELENQLDIDVWSFAVPGRPGQVLVPKTLRENFENTLKSIGIEFKVAVENIKEKLDLEDTLLKSNSKTNRSADGTLSFDVIHTYDEVNAILDELARNYPQTVSLVTAGKTIEGRDMKYVKISSNGFQNNNKPAVFLQSLLHGRAWLTLPTTLYAIKQLVIDVTEQDLAQDIDWIILPVANPDGYVFTEEGVRYNLCDDESEVDAMSRETKKIWIDCVKDETRFYRKNRAGGFIQADVCMGVDLNRNFDINWAEASSNIPCRDDFHGLGPFSEPEAAVIRDIFTEYRHKIKLFLDIHCYGSNIVYGYGIGPLPPNALNLHVLGIDMAQAIDAVRWPSHPDYTVGNSNLIRQRQNSGTPIDYALSLGIPLSYAIELPAFMNFDGYLGFFVDPEFIEQAGYETWLAIKIAARSLL